MNGHIRRHFDLIEARLIESPAVLSFQIIRREISLNDGKLLVKATLSDGGVFAPRDRLLSSSHQPLP